MPLFTFRVYWEEDDNIFRDIVLKSGQTFLDFQKIILEAFEFTVPKPSLFFESNDKWSEGRAISSEVLVNKKNAPALSMLKTPVSALIEKPDQKFIYAYDEGKWTFLIALFSIEKENSQQTDFPYISKSEGLAPSQTRLKGLANEKLMELEEKYDLKSEDMDEQGFGNDDDLSESSDDNESFNDEDSDELNF